MSNKNGFQPIEIQYLDEISEIVRFNLFATHLFSGLGYGVLYYTLSLLIAFIFTADTNFLFGAASTAFLTYLFLKYSNARSNAKIKPLKIVSVILLALAPIYLLLVIAFSIIFLTHNYYNYPAISGRIILLVPIAIFVAYLSRIYLKSQTLVWTDAYENYSVLVQKAKREFGPLYGMLPQYEKSAKKYKRIAAWFFSSISTLFLGLAIIMIAFYPLGALGGIIVDGDGEFKFGDLSTPEAILYMSETGGIEHYWGIALGGLPVIFLLPAIMIGLGAPFRILSLALIKQNSDLVRKHDLRPHVIYLRSFLDDKMKIQSSVFSLFKYLTQTYHIKRLDELVAERLWYIGPVIALANPTKSTASMSGPALKKEPHYNWKNSVLKEINNANFIVVNINSSESLKWEIEQCLRDTSIKKSLFITGLRDDVKRVDDLREFCLKSDIPVVERILKDTILMFYTNNNWVFYCAKNRRIYDYDAALLKAASVLL